MWEKKERAESRTESRGRGDARDVKEKRRRETDEGGQCDSELEGGLIAPVRYLSDGWSD